MMGVRQGRESEDAQYVELLWPIVPRGDVDGSLDWISGVIALDVSHELWSKFEEAPLELKGPAVRAYSHELVHYLQFATLGFMHDWAAQLFALIRPAMKRVQDKTAPDDFSGVKRLITQGSALLSEQETQALAAHFLQLDTPGNSSLTARALFEGHAHFVERRLNYAMHQSSDWTPHLKGAPGAVYRVAFDVLAFAAGYGVAYEWFPAVASISLCCRKPTAAFERLTLALARDKTVRELRAEPGTVREMVAFLQRQLAGTELLTPLERVTAAHPVFTNAALAIRHAVAEGACDVFQLFGRPDLQIPTLRQRDALDPPIIFKPAPPSTIAIQAPPGQDEGSIFALFTLGAIGQRLTHSVANESWHQGERHLAQLSWLVRDHLIVFVDLAAEDLRSGNPSRMRMIFDPKGEAADMKPKLWGRVVLRMPRELDPTQEALLPRIPEVRRLFRALHQCLPMFPLYLAAQGWALYDWFGSIGPEAALDDSGVNLMDPEILALVEEAERAIDKCGQSINLNPWLAVQCLFAPLYELPTIDP